MSDIADFLKSYKATLQHEIAAADMPPALTEQFTFDSLEKKQPGREVYFVTRKSDGKRGVLRVTGADGIENAAAESAILNRLDHPAIPKAFGVWEHNGRSFLVREYFSGDDLHAHVLRYGPLGFETLTDIALRLCDILSYLHSQSPAIIHRDIKPENIIISGRNDVKLIDFGIARNDRQKTEDAENDKDTRVAGTRPYMAPEQFGSEQTDNRADIYSLGVVMIFMATCKPDKLNLKSTCSSERLATHHGEVYKKTAISAIKQRCNSKAYFVGATQADGEDPAVRWSMCCPGRIFLHRDPIGRTQGFKAASASSWTLPPR